MLVLEAFCLLFAAIVTVVVVGWLFCGDWWIRLWRRGQTRLRHEAEVAETHRQAECAEGKSREEARWEVEQAGEAVRRIIEDLENKA